MFWELFAGAGVYLEAFSLGDNNIWVVRRSDDAELATRDCGHRQSQHAVQGVHQICVQVALQEDALAAFLLKIKNKTIDLQKWKV